MALVGTGVAAASLYSLDLLKLANVSVPSVIDSLTQTQTLSQTSTSSAEGPMPDALQIPHLLRRAGFGAAPGELQQYQAMGFSSAVDSLLNYQTVDDSQLDAVQPAITMAYSGKRTANELNALATWWLNRLVNTKHPLEEKMTLFWHNHFATGYEKVRNGLLMYNQNQFLRSNALGNFKDILTGMTADGAMLVWLDGDLNRKGNPNENYAREIMEVFSTGRGPYTEDDVKAGALAMTGYRIDSSGNGVFMPKLHDDSIKTYLGSTGDLGPSDVIDILVAHPATAATLSTELFSFLAYPFPSKDTVDALSQVYLSSGYSIKAVVEAILKSPEFISTQAYLSQVKSPAEFVANGMRGLGATIDPVKAVTNMKAMGQMLFDPPSVFGWPPGLAWINTASVLERYNFPLLLQTTKENPVSNLNQGVFTSAGSDSPAIQRLVGPLFPEGIPAEFMQVIESTTSALSDPVQKTKNAVRLAMSSPFYNLN